MDYDKKVFCQWWTALTLSKNYRKLCDAINSKGPVSSEEIINIVSTLSPKDSLLLRLCFVYTDQFGDVFRTSFEDWWKSRKPKKAIIPVNKIEDCFIDETRHENLPLALPYGSKEIQKHINKFPSKYRTFHIDVTQNIEKITREIRAAIRKSKPKLKYEPLRDLYFKCLKLDIELEAAGKKRDIRLTGIIKEYGKITQKEDTRNENVRDVFRRYLNNAKKLVESAEQGYFP